MNLDNGDDDEKEEEYIYVPQKDVARKDIQVPKEPIFDITTQEIKGIFPRELRNESCKVDVANDEFVKSVPFKKLVW